MEIRTFGDWRAKTGRWTKAATRQLEEQALPALREIGEEIARNVRERIRTQRIGGPPLAQSTIDKKGHSKKLIEHGLYLNSLKVTVGRRPGGRKLFLFTRVESTARDGNIGIYQEFGTSTIPARPHWRPAIREVRRGTMMRDFLKGKWFSLTFSNSERSG